MNYRSMHSPVGELTLFEEDEKLVAVDWGWADGGGETPVLTAARQQIEDYFDGRRRRFDLPLALEGTSFQQMVWAALQRIPYGEVLNYGALAAQLGSAPRPVGGACARNPLPIIVPCHRVVAADGSLGGYSGLNGVDTKRVLLALEGRKIA